MKETSDQIQQFLGRAMAWAVEFFQLVWAWSTEQIVKLTQAPWENLPLWKQILLLIVVVAMAYSLWIVVRRLWRAVMNLFYAFATFVGALILTLPTIAIAGVIALAGLWVIYSLHDISSLHSLITGHKPGSDSK
jgi:hypothetical protein